MEGPCKIAIIDKSSASSSICFVDRYAELLEGTWNSIKNKNVTSTKNQLEVSHKPNEIDEMDHDEI